MWGEGIFHSRSESTDQNQFMHLPVLSRSLQSHLFTIIVGEYCRSEGDLTRSHNCLTCLQTYWRVSWRILPTTRRSYPTTRLPVAPTYWYVVKLIPCRIQVLIQQYNSRFFSVQKLRYMQYKRALAFSNVPQRQMNLKKRQKPFMVKITVDKKQMKKI